jgi:hypothetical protein
VRFAVWAPNAAIVSVTGDFNGWDRTRHPMRLRDGGIWEIFLPGLGAGTSYKYSILSNQGTEQDKCDPYGFFAEVPSRTASIVWPLTNYTWSDGEWMERRPQVSWLREPVAIYEVHLESWMRGPSNACLTYRELAERSRSFEAIAVMKPWQPTLTGPAEPERFEGQRVSASYFHALGITRKGSRATLRVGRGHVPHPAKGMRHFRRC